jgi:hypothetical protein
MIVKGYQCSRAKTLHHTEILHENALLGKVRRIADGSPSVSAPVFSSRTPLGTDARLEALCKRR